MKNLIKKIIVLSIILGASNIFAQDIEVNLRSDDSTSGFTVKDSSGAMLMNVRGDGSIGTSAPISDSVFFQVARPIDPPYKRLGRSIFLQAEISDGSVSTKAGSIFLMSGDPLGAGDHGSHSSILLHGGHASGKGGNIEIKSGRGSTVDGDINIRTGDLISSAESKIMPERTTWRKTGDINLYTGRDGYLTSDGGDFNVTCASSQSIAGSILLNAGNAWGTAGEVNIKAGDSDIIAGNISLIAGTSANSVGMPGNISLSAGDGQSAGGNIYLTPGIDQADTNDGLVLVNGSGTFTGTWTQTSDRRLKKNIQSLDDQREKILKLNPVTYKMRKDEYPDKNLVDGEQIGLIAQEVEELYPMLVKSDQQGYKSVDYSKLSVVLLKALKDQQILIEELLNRIEKLEMGK